MNAKSHLGFQTEVEFELPKGYVDEEGILHRRGVMRLATAADEILPLRDPRVQQNEAYLAVIVLARVIVKLGTLADIHTGMFLVVCPPFSLLDSFQFRLSSALDCTSFFRF